ncbi:MAG: YkgJ family cysteine cluster protein [archaeon]|nr:YkgJ family cysteine cluster protein [Candidatus Dependentiae bacterium]
MKAEMALKICQKCKAACCKMGGPDFSKSEMKKVLKAGHPNYFVELNPNHFELKGKKGRCHYLTNSNSCRIHNERPLMCKCWPVYVNYKNNKKEFVLIECPLTSQLSKKDIQIMKYQASRIPKEIITNSFSSSKFPKSDIKIVEMRFNKFKQKPLN